MEKIVQGIHSNEVALSSFSNNNATEDLKPENFSLLNDSPAYAKESDTDEIKKQSKEIELQKVETTDPSLIMIKPRGS